MELDIHEKEYCLSDATSQSQKTRPEMSLLVFQEGYREQTTVVHGCCSLLLELRERWCELTYLNAESIFCNIFIRFSMHYLKLLSSRIPTTVENFAMILLVRLYIVIIIPLGFKRYTLLFWNLEATPVKASIAVDNVCFGGSYRGGSGCASGGLMSAARARRGNGIRK